MDPFSALGLASNVVQFIDFALKLVNGAAEIAQSSKGLAERTLEFENVYVMLKGFGSSLQQDSASLPPSSIIPGYGPSEGTSTHRDAIKVHTTALRNIGKDCSAVCDQLLTVVENIRVKGTSNRRIKSFVAAFNQALSGKKICELEERLRRFQTLLALHFFPLLKYGSLALSSTP